VSFSSQEWREQLAKVSKNRCGYCLTQEAVSGVRLTLEHIIPLSKGGQTEESNLWLSCRLCNESKGILTEHPDLESGSTVPLFNPYSQNWSDHFAWNEAGSRIVGLTPIGRATIEALDLNNEFRVRSRAIWVEAGWHPPAS
jgi:HNH endonuclease